MTLPKSLELTLKKMGRFLKINWVGMLCLLLPAGSILIISYFMGGEDYRVLYAMRFFIIISILSELMFYFYYYHNELDLTGKNKTKYMEYRAEIDEIRALGAVFSGAGISSLFIKQGAGLLSLFVIPVACYFLLLAVIRYRHLTEAIYWYEENSKSGSKPAKKTYKIMVEEL